MLSYDSGPDPALRRGGKNREKGIGNMKDLESAAREATEAGYQIKVGIEKQIQDLFFNDILPQLEDPKLVYSMVDGTLDHQMQSPLIEAFDAVDEAIDEAIKKQLRI
jgi:hypothetical protein